MYLYDVMLVDDERWVRTSIHHTFKQIQLPFHIVFECSNGLEALKWLETNKVDLVMTDVKMPVMDGITLAEQLRLKCPDIQVILVSGYQEAELLQKAIRSKVHDYLLKPVDSEDLSQCLQRYLSEQGYSLSEQSTIQQILYYIHESMPGNVTLTEVAERVHLNPSYVSHLFHKETGSRFVDYVTQLRMEEARKLLMKTSLRISEIADKLHYVDLAFFSKTFKKVFGQSPVEYRNQARAMRA